MSATSSGPSVWLADLCWFVPGPSPLRRFTAVLRLSPGTAFLAFFRSVSPLRPPLSLLCRRTRPSSTADSSPAHQPNGFSFRPTVESLSQLLLLRLVSICHLCRRSIACRNRVAARAFQSTSRTPFPRFHGHTCTQIAQSVVKYVQYLSTTAR